MNMRIEQLNATLRVKYFAVIAPSTIAIYVLTQLTTRGNMHTREHYDKKDFC